MTSKKDKQIRELKSSLFNWKAATVFLLMVSVSLILAAVFLETNDEFELKEQLQSCQEKVPVWTLKVECVDTEYANYIYFEDNYTDYELYLEVIDRFDEFNDFENCKVLNGIN